MNTCFLIAGARHGGRHMNASGFERPARLELLHANER